MKHDVKHDEILMVTGKLSDNIMAIEQLGSFC